MAIGTTNITTTLVRSTLGEDNNAIGSLCNSTYINKWSKKKPVRGTWPISVNNNYGIDHQNLWAYQKPRGIDYSERYRIGDFRGYEHTQSLTLPPAYVRHDGTTFVGRTEYSPTGYYSISGTLKLNTGQVSEITLSDLGLAGYYFGMFVNRPAHSEFWFKTLGVVAADNQFISASIAMSSPYTSYNDFPFLVQDGLPINVQFILSSSPITSWSSTGPSVYFRLPQEIVAGIDMRSSYNMTIAHWAIPEPSSISFPYQSYVEGDIVIHSDINSSTLPAGWVIISKPSWINTRVYDNHNNRITAGPFYDGMSIYPVPNSNNTGSARNGSIVIGDTSSHSIAQISVHQNGSPAKAYIHIDGFSATGASVSINYGGGSIHVTFTPTDLSATSVYISATVLDGYSQVGFNNTHMARNGNITSFDVDISPDAQEGHTYHVYIQEGQAPYFPE